MLQRLHGYKASISIVFLGRSTQLENPAHSGIFEANEGTIGALATTDVTMKLYTIGYVMLCRSVMFVENASPSMHGYIYAYILASTMATLLTPPDVPPS